MPLWLRHEMPSTRGYSTSWSAVSRATSDTSLCLAAKNEERCQAELKKWNGTNPISRKVRDNPIDSPANHNRLCHQSSQQSSHATSQTAPGDVGRRVPKLNCSGHMYFNSGIELRDQYHFYDYRTMTKLALNRSWVVWLEGMDKLCFDALDYAVKWVVLCSNSKHLLDDYYRK